MTGKVRLVSVESSTAEKTVGAFVYRNTSALLLLGCQTYTQAASQGQVPSLDLKGNASVRY